MPRILVADDSKPIRRVAELSLEALDAEVRVAADGDEALEIVDAGYVPEIALLDVHMPGTGGLELCSELCARFPHLQVLMMAGTFEPFDEDEAAQAGATGHLLKPFAADELRSRVEELLSGHADSEAGSAPPVPSILTPPQSDSESALTPEAPAGGLSEGDPSAVEQTTGAGDDRAEQASGEFEPRGDTSPFSDEALDALARKVADYLAERLTPPNVEELFTRVAGEEVRRRIQQLEAELDEVDD